MATTRDALNATLREVFPVREGPYSLELVNDEPLDSAGKLVVRLIVWEVAASGERSIRDIKEQELYFVDQSWLDSDVPLLEWVRGWGEAVREVFAHPKPNLEWLMPHDLGPGDTLKLRRANTAADYKEAMLKKSRLGKYRAEP